MQWSSVEQQYTVHNKWACDRHGGTCTSHAARRNVEPTFNNSDLRLVLARTDFQCHGRIVNSLQSSFVVHQRHGNAAKHLVYLVFPHVIRHVACFVFFRYSKMTSSTHTGSGSAAQVGMCPFSAQLLLNVHTSHYVTSHEGNRSRPAKVSVSQK